MANKFRRRGKGLGSPEFVGTDFGPIGPMVGDPSIPVTAAPTDFSVDVPGYIPPEPIVEAPVRDAPISQIDLFPEGRGGGFVPTGPTMGQYGGGVPGVGLRSGSGTGGGGLDVFTAIATVLGSVLMASATKDAAKTQAEAMKKSSLPGQLRPERHFTPQQQQAFEGLGEDILGTDRDSVSRDFRTRIQRLRENVARRRQ